jgi:diguanylate cyclase (GGDEF)-like protein
MATTLGLTCQACGGALPDDAVYCPRCATGRDDPSTAPLYVVDRMTGLFNDTFTGALVDHETSRAVRYKRPLTVLIGVVDHVEFIKQDLGPAKAADLLREVADVLQGAVRDIDTVGWLGDRYCIVLPETDASGSHVAADKVMHAVATHQYEAGGNWGRVTMSFGAASVNADRMGRQDLIELASDALREGREDGGTNRIHVAHTQL